MEHVDVLLDPLRAFMYHLGAFLPKLGIVLVILIVGFLVAKGARFAVEKALRAVNVPVLTRRSGLDDFLQAGGGEADTVSVFGILVYWVVVLAALIVAFNSLGLEQVTNLLGRAMLYVPQIVFALLIVVFGAYFARFVGQAVAAHLGRGSGADGAALGRVARSVVLAIVLVAALDQLDIGGSIVRATYLILLGGVVFALALAFGLGGRDWAAARLEEWWPSSERPREPRP
jgi:hypothetical protein